MNKTSIKVIKRKDALISAAAETQSPREPKLVITASEEKSESVLHRSMVDTVSSWIYKRRENNRIEEITAIRKMFGNETLLNGS